MRETFQKYFVWFYVKQVQFITLRTVYIIVLAPSLENTVCGLLWIELIYIYEELTKIEKNNTALLWQ